MTQSSDIDVVCAMRRAERARCCRRIAFGHAEAVLRSACATLRAKPFEMVSTMTISLPFDNDEKTGFLEDLAARLASEYGLLAEVEGGLNLKVRLVRAIAE